MHRRRTSLGNVSNKQMSLTISRKEQEGAGESRREQERAGERKKNEDIKNPLIFYFEMP